MDPINIHPINVSIYTPYMDPMGNWILACFSIMTRYTWPWSQDWQINGALEFSWTCQTTLAQILLDWISKPLQGHEKIYEQIISDPEIDSCQTVPNRYFCVANQYQPQWFNSSSWSVHCARGTLCQPLCGLQRWSMLSTFLSGLSGTLLELGVGLDSN